MSCDETPDPPPRSATPILVVTKKPPSPDELRMLHKLLLSAGLPRNAALVHDATDRTVLWDAMKRVKPPVLIPMGPGPSKLLLKGKSGFKLAAFVGRPCVVNYLPKGTIVVPSFGLNHLLGRGMGRVEDTIKTLLWVKLYTGVAR